MEAQLPILDRIRVATPCTASWEQMKGDQKKRFCDQCKLHVHNFSAMTGTEIQQLIEGAAGKRICGRLFRRADGTMITSDCPAGLAALRRKVARVVAGAAAAVLSAVGIFTFLRSGSPRATVAAAPPVTSAKPVIATPGPQAAPPAPVIPAPVVTSVTDIEPIKTICEWIAPATNSTIQMMGDIVLVPPQARGSQGNGR